MIQLPIDAFLPEITRSLSNHSQLVLSASPGAGKTTRLPPALLASTDKKILVLEPRRIAAVAAAKRIADENNWQLGHEVGYQIRFDSNFKASTRLIFLTEALLNRRLLQDPELSDVGIVVLDEFHERSQHVDLAIGMLKELQALSRTDLKVVVMSATLQKDSICNFLETQNYFSVPGLLFPLEIENINAAQRLQTGPEFIQLVASSVKQACKNSKPGEHCLVFLPGVGEIERVSEALNSWAQEQKYSVHKLHGNLSLEEQQSVLAPFSGIKVILSTNIAESSLTIDGVRRVIDSGLQRRASINPRTGFPQLEIARISQSSATQRSGRAARQAPGKCLRLWSKLDQQSMPAEEVAEILRVDLAEALLFLSEAGISDANNFSWFEKPKPEQINKAKKHLLHLGATNASGSITSFGKQLLKWPLPPRLAALMELADELKIGETGARICALLTERDIFSGQRSDGNHSNEECDILLRLDYFLKHRSLERVALQLKKLLKNSSRMASSDEIKKLLLLSFKDQICQRRSGDSNSKALMIGGTGVVLDSKSCVKKSEYFVAITVIDGLSDSESRVSVASGFPEEWLQQLGTPSTSKTIEYDEKTEKFFSISSQAILIKDIGSIQVGKKHIVAADANAVSAALAEIAAKNFSKLLTKNLALKAWWQRLQYYNSNSSQPIEFSEAEQLEAFEQACFGENSLQALYDKDLVYFFEQKIPGSANQQFNRNCPEIFEAPTGSKIKIDYSESAPKVEIRLQELFGQTSAPTIFEGKKNLVLVLLGPHFRPIQVTQDLMSFWKNGYLEVRKELRSRYPKHSWPDDPLTAPPQARGRRRF